MRTTYIYILSLMVLLVCACGGDVADVQQGETGKQDSDVREMVDISFTASLGDAYSGSAKGSAAYSAEKGNTAAYSGAAHRVAYSQGVGALLRNWETSEQLGVYIKKTDGSILRAGSISSTGATTDEERTFSGTVAKLASGESYVYMSPDKGGTAGEAASATINYGSQSGALGSTAHLKNLIPMVWRNGNIVAEMQGYVLHLVLTFKEDPGAITSVAVQTMTMGDDGTTQDRIFPVAFKTANLGKDVNSTLAAAKTKGTALASDADYTNTVTLTVSGTNAATDNGDGTYTAEAYIASADVKNIDVFRTKYNVKVVAAAGTYYSDYKSMPGQAGATSDAGLAMLSNGNSYRLRVKMSKGYAPTIISDNFKVNSLLGMWNKFGKAYDPQGLIVTDMAQWPAALQTAIGDDSKQTAVKTRITSSVTSGTPNWLGPQANSLYATGNAADMKQDNVTFNNIRITAPTEVFFTIVSEFGWNQNLLGYYYYPTANEGSVTSGSVTKNIIFADVSKPGHEPFAKGETGHRDVNNVGTSGDAPIQEFETVKLLYTDANGYTSTTFPAETTIGFWMMIDPEANIIVDGDGSTVDGYNHRQYDLMRWSQWRLFTNSAWNAENTLANGASSNWPSTGYTNSNFFASGDVCNGSGNPIDGLAIYGVKDNGLNANNYAYGAMIFMVSTSVPTAMQTQNKAYFNIGTGNLVIAKKG